MSKTDPQQEDSEGVDMAILRAYSAVYVDEEEWYARSADKEAEGISAAFYVVSIISI